MRAALLGLCFTFVQLLATRGLRAQGSTRAGGAFSVGGARIAQPGIAATGVLTAGVDLAADGDRASAAASGLVAVAPDARTTAQALGALSLVGEPTASGLLWQLGASGSAFTQSDTSITASGGVSAHEELLLRTGSVRAGVSLGAVGVDGRARAALAADAAWLRRFDLLGRDELAAIVAVNRLDGQPDVQAVTLTFADLTVALRHERGRLAVGATATARAGNAAMRSASLFGDATVALAAVVDVVASAGRTLPDPVRGIPSVRLVSAALRVRVGGSERPAIRPRAVAPADGSLLAQRVDSAVQRIVVHAASAATVEMMADFTSWEPVALVRDPNASIWAITLPLAAGTHRVAIRIDGGEWIAPANLPSASDDFGGRIGLLIVP